LQREKDRAADAIEHQEGHGGRRGDTNAGADKVTGCAWAHPRLLAASSGPRAMLLRECRTIGKTRNTGFTTISPD
jgi:hypothetical protein